MTAPARKAALGALAASGPGWQLNGDPGRLVTGIAYNSNRISPGDLFVALRGGYFDGHDYAVQAIAAGAAALLVERPMGLGVPEIIVPDARSALASVAAAFFDQPSRKLMVIGITGTDGKTTTSYLLDWILRQSGKRTGMIGTISVVIDQRAAADETRQTTPESLDVQRHLADMVEAGVDVAIIEATSHGLDLHRLDAVRFKFAGVTNITHEHLEHHKTIAAYRRAKAKLFERVDEINGAAVINLDDAGAVEMLPFTAGSSVVTYSLESEATLRGRAVRLGVDGSVFELVHDGVVRQVRLPMLGGYNISNALCAAGLALTLGIDLDCIVESLAHAPAIPGRMEQIDLGQPFTVVVDYAHTPDALMSVLTLLRSLNPDGRLIVVSGSGGERDVAKRPLQGAVCASLADYCIFTTEDPRQEDAAVIIAQIAAGAVARGAADDRVFVQITDRQEAIQRAIDRARPGDVVLLAGKGHERSIIWGLEKRPWDEAAAARAALTARGYGSQS